MDEGTHATDRKLVRVGVADVAVSGNGAALATSGLGSCVAIALYDTSGTGVGGLLHAMLPAAPDQPENAAKYVDTGLDQLVEQLAAAGGNTNELTAKFAGGSSMLNIGTGGGIGAKNVSATEAGLADRDIDVTGSDTGGGSGRSIRFHPNTGEFVVERVDNQTLTL